jgi:hypothetical protein
VQVEKALEAKEKEVRDTCLLLTGLELALLILNRLNMSQLAVGGCRVGEEGQCLVSRVSY